MNDFSHLNTDSYTCALCGQKVKKADQAEHMDTCHREDTAMNEDARYTLVRKLKVGDRVYLGSDHPMQLIEVEHLGGGLTKLHGPGGIVVSKDSREAVFVAP